MQLGFFSLTEGQCALFVTLILTLPCLLLKWEVRADLTLDLDGLDAPGQAGRVWPVASWFSPSGSVSGLYSTGCSVVQFGLDLRAHCETDVTDKQAAFLAFKCSEKEKLLAENVFLCTTSKRVSWDPGPYELFMLRSERGSYSSP